MILYALENQSVKDFEVIISEDDYNEATFDFVKKVKSAFNFAINHLHQTKDDGFRKNQMLNKAIQSAASNKLAFIDSDCVPHRHFVKEYIKNIDDYSFCVGRSVMLGEKITSNAKSKKITPRLLSVLFSDSRLKKEGVYFPYFGRNRKVKGLVGRNWGCNKQLLIDINGFDEDYIQAGIGEDTDIDWRLRANGINRKSVKNKAIVYHLYHPRWYSTDVERDNYNQMKSKQDRDLVFCENGIQKV